MRQEDSTHQPSGVFCGNCRTTNSVHEGVATWDAILRLRSDTMASKGLRTRNRTCRDPRTHVHTRTHT